VAGKQTRQSIGSKSLAPSIDITVAAVELLANFGPSQIIGKQQNEPGMTR
jgi:hypothetical protein